MSDLFPSWGEQLRCVHPFDTHDAQAPQRHRPPLAGLAPRNSAGGGLRREISAGKAPQGKLRMAWRYPRTLSVLECWHSQCRHSRALRVRAALPPATFLVEGSVSRPASARGVLVEGNVITREKTLRMRRPRNRSFILRMRIRKPTLQIARDNS